MLCLRMSILMFTGYNISFLFNLDTIFVFLIKENLFDS